MKPYACICVRLSGQSLHSERFEQTSEFSGRDFWTKLV
jgi:hypothetical protein